MKTTQLKKKVSKKKTPKKFSASIGYGRDAQSAFSDLNPDPPIAGLVTQNPGGPANASLCDLIQPVNGQGGTRFGKRFEMKKKMEQKKKLSLTTTTGHDSFPPPTPLLLPLLFLALSFFKPKNSTIRPQHLDLDLPGPHRRQLGASAPRGAAPGDEAAGDVLQAEGDLQQAHEQIRALVSMRERERGKRDGERGREGREMERERERGKKRWREGEYISIFST